MRFCQNLILLFFIFPFVFNGQTVKKDLSKVSYDELKIRYFEKTNTKEKIELAATYILKAKTERNDIKIAKGNYLLALLYYNNNSSKALSYLDSVIKYSRNCDDNFFPAAAYNEKASILKKQFKFREAIVNYNYAEKYALKKNLDYYYIIRNSIGITKSEDLGEVKEALDIFKECYAFYTDKDIYDSKYSRDYLNVVFGLADTYKALNKIDSATYYNKLGYQKSKIIKDVEYLNLFILNEGATQVIRKNYQSTLDSINKSLPVLLKLNDNGNVLASYYYRAKAYEGLKKKELAVVNYLKVDSIYNKHKRITPEFTSGYIYLIEYFKNKNDKENQLKYLTKYMIIDSTLGNNYKKLDKLLQNEYDFPHLVKDKQELIDSLESGKKYYYWGIGALVICLIALWYNQVIIRRKFKQRFDKIIAENSISTKEKKDSNKIQNKLNKEGTPQDKNIGIAEDLICQILKLLEQFELKNNFLKPNITIQLLSDEFNTNTKYLSRIVNEYKGKPFINYINDLRIEYAMKNLQEDKKIRKYTLQALANEYGFNSAESFSIAFYKKAGIKPVYFIKELEKINI